MIPEHTGLRGIIPSLNTPFDPDGAIDRKAVSRLVEHVARSGCAGALGLAAAGETAHLSPGEWRVIAQDIADAGRGRLPTILSVTAHEMGESRERARIAGRLGVGLVLWQPPDRATRALIGDGIAALADDAGCQVMLQDLDFIGVGLPLDWIVDLFDRIDGFASLKIEIADAGPKYSAVLDATDGRLHVAGGWAVRTMTDALARGVHAFMPTGMEPLYVAVDRLWRAGELRDAERLFAHLAPILAFSNLDLDHSIRFFKRMRHRSGLFASDRVRVMPDWPSPRDEATADRLIDLAAELERRWVQPAAGQTA